MELPFNGYVWKARVAPALITVAPLIAVLYVWSPLRPDPANALTGSIALSAATALLAALARSAGKTAETKLLASWGGMPSIIFMRWSDITIDRFTKERYRSVLAKHLPEVSFPSAEQEASDPVAADGVYEACRRFLLSKTRDNKKFSLLFAENIDYGFRRNLFGLRSVGICFSAVALLASTVRVWHDFAAKSPLSPNAVTCLAVSAVFIVTFSFYITAEWVRHGADAYAVRQLEAIDQLDTPDSVVPSSGAAGAEVESKKVRKKRIKVT